jgi:hypothetical protein
MLNEKKYPQVPLDPQAQKAYDRIFGEANRLREQEENSYEAQQEREAERTPFYVILYIIGAMVIGALLAH